MFATSNGNGNVVMFLKKLEKDQKILRAKFFDQHGWSQEVKISDNLIHYQVQYIIFLRLVLLRYYNFDF